MVTGERIHPRWQTPGPAAVRDVSSAVPSLGTDTDACATGATSAPEPTPLCPGHSLGPRRVASVQREHQAAQARGPQFRRLGRVPAAFAFPPSGSRLRAGAPPAPAGRGPAPPLPPGYLAPRPPGDRGARAGEAAAAAMVRDRAGRSRPAGGQRATWGARPEDEVRGRGCRPGPAPVPPPPPQCGGRGREPAGGQRLHWGRAGWEGKVWPLARSVQDSSFPPP